MNIEQQKRVDEVREKSLLTRKEAKAIRDTIRELAPDFSADREAEMCEATAQAQLDKAFNLKDKDGNPLIYIADEQSKPTRYFTAYEGTDAQGYILAQQDMANFRKVIEVEQ